MEIVDRIAQWCSEQRVNYFQKHSLRQFARDKVTLIRFNNDHGLKSNRQLKMIIVNIHLVEQQRTAEPNYSFGNDQSLFSLNCTA